MKTTANYGLKKPDGTDVVNIDDFNFNADKVDTELGTRLLKTGDGSNVTTTFSQGTARANLVSGEKLNVSFGKLMKWFTDLKTVAFSGNYSDLTGRPSIPGAYTHPSTHPPGVIAQNANNRFVTDGEKTTWNGKAAKSIAVSATLTVAGWTGSAAPYTQSVTVAGVTATNNIEIGLAQTATKEQLESGGAGMLMATAQGANSVTVKAYGDKPGVALPVSVIILG